MALQSSGMLSKDQLLQLFQSNFELLDKPEVKRRIQEAVRAGKEAAAATTKVQEELLLSMGIEPNFGIQCLGRVNEVYKNDRELMLKFYEFVSREELACDEAEMPAEEFREKLEAMRGANQQQLKVLYQLRRHPVEQQRNLLHQMNKQLVQSQRQTPERGSMSPGEIFEFFQGHESFSYS